MLNREQIKACLAGEPTPIVPAYLFWFDGKFIEKNRDWLDAMRKLYENDFHVRSCEAEWRPGKPEMEPGEFVDGWGCLFASAPDGVGSHPARPIIRSVSDWEAYMQSGIPVINPDTFTTGVRQVVAGNPDKYVVATFWRTFYERMYMLIGFENLMMAMADESDLFLCMLNDLRDYTVRGIEAIAPSGADAVFLADDWGTQHRLQASPAMWRKHFKPAYAEMIETAHSHGLDVWFHSCGQITEIIPEWIDVGLDVIAHLQAKALDLPAIAEAYRGRMTFFGGIDVQDNLVRGTRESIREEVRRLMAAFRGHNGRYICSPSNSIMPETPAENVGFMFEAIKEFGAAA